MVATEREGEVIPTIKISENVSKITTPGFKNVFRFYDKDHGKAIADVITLHDEEIPKDEYELFHPVFTWKRKTISNYEVRPLLKRIYDKGNLVYDVPSLESIRENTVRELDSLWDEVKRLSNPQEYVVDLSYPLWKMKDDLLAKHGGKNKPE